MATVLEIVGTARQIVAAAVRSTAAAARRFWRRTW
jgi:hypothetical protein